MAYLTEEQAALLAWMVEAGPGPFVFQAVYGDTQTILGPGQQERELEPGDLRQLVDYGLIRQTTEHGYEVTNEGRETVEQLKNPPEPPPVGFRPQR
jgi:hypothetical protein